LTAKIDYVESFKMNDFKVLQLLCETFVLSANV